MTTCTIGELKQRLLDISAPDKDGVYRNGPAKRAARTELAMQAMRDLWERACEQVPFDVPEQGVGLAAVGSLARGQFGPSSDLDLVLIHDGRVLNEQRLGELANHLWYPIWDGGIDLDHSVRSRAQCESVTDGDMPAAVGWLDVRPIAGDAALIESVATSILERWRKAARRRLNELTQSAEKRLHQSGRLPYLNQPDIKEARGGLRDATLVAAIAASWLADRPHGRYDDAVEAMLDVRDCLHVAAGKDTNLLLSVYQQRVATMLGLADPTLPDEEREARSIDDLQTRLARLGRCIAFALDDTASRASRSLTHVRPRFAFFQLATRIISPAAAPSAAAGLQSGREAPSFDIVAPGIARHEGEIVLAPNANPQEDRTLALRAAVAAAELHLPINTGTLRNLSHYTASVGGWDDVMREQFIRLLTSGPELIRVWEALDSVGIPENWMPEWAAIRNRPSASAAHRYTVDRHSIEVASRLGERARHYGAHRFTALVLAGLLHDIGKRPGVADHAVEGMRHAKAVAERMGFDADVVQWVTLLVREHLTLSEYATGRDPEDPAVGLELAIRLENDPILLDMLYDLTRADGSSLGATAGEAITKRYGWSAWRERLVAAMADAARRNMTVVQDV